MSKFNAKNGNSVGTLRAVISQFFFLDTVSVKTQLKQSGTPGHFFLKASLLNKTFHHLNYSHFSDTCLG